MQQKGVHCSLEALFGLREGVANINDLFRARRRAAEGQEMRAPWKQCPGLFQEELLPQSLRAQFLGDPPLLPQCPMPTPFYSASPHLGRALGCGASLPPPCTLQPWGGAALIQAYAGKHDTDTSPDAQGDSPLIRAFQHFPQHTVGFMHRCCLREGVGTLTEGV